MEWVFHSLSKKRKRENEREIARGRAATVEGKEENMV